MGVKRWIANRLGLSAGKLRWVTATQMRQSMLQMQGRQIRAKFDSAQTTTENSRHWAQADGLTADQAASPGVRMVLRNRARYEVANNSYARGILDTYAADLVGEGPTLQMHAGDGSDKTKRFNSGIERLFRQWSNEIDLPGLLRTSSVTKKESGEMFGQLYTNPRQYGENKLSMRLVEADRVETPTFRGEDADTIDGIKFDRYGNPVSYSVLDQPVNPLFGIMGTKFDTVPHRFMIHWYRSDRPGQHRGLPEIMPALPLFAQLRAYTLAVIAAAEIAADLNAILETQAQANIGDDLDLLPPMDTLPIERGMFTAAPAGYTLKQMRAEQPTQQYSDFKRQIVNEIARCISMPANIAAGDSSGYNFASGRLDHMTYDKIINTERSDLERKVLERIFRAWAEEWGLIRDSGEFSGFAPPADIWTSAHSWVWTPRKHADPLKEAMAEKTFLENGTTTRRVEILKKGGDPDEIEQQRLLEQEAEPAHKRASGLETKALMEAYAKE